MVIEDRLTTLQVLWSAWKERGQSMTDEQWARPTRLGDWDVRSLYAHVGGWPFGFSMLVGQVRDADPTHPTAAALLRDFNRPGGVAKARRDRVAAGAREDAATYGTVQMIETFAVVGPQAIATARRLGPVVIDYFGLAALRLDEAVSIGIMEATVHLLDLHHALGLPPDVPADGLAHTVAVLAEMASPVDFIEAATGRGAVEVFPVLT